VEVEFLKHANYEKLFKRHRNFSPAIRHDKPEEKSSISELRLSTSAVEAWSV
jgi:hypothetical protein